MITTTLGGYVLPTQLLYEGKTNRCHPNFAFPKGWDISHTETHWANAESHQQLIENIIIPYVSSVRAELQRPEQKALLIQDVYRAHQNEASLKLLADNSILVKFVPPNLTSLLQPNDQLINQQLKLKLQKEYSLYYTGEFLKQINLAAGLMKVQVESRLSAIKPLHAGWIVSAIEALTPTIVRKSWCIAGLAEAIVESTGEDAQKELHDIRADELIDLDHFQLPDAAAADDDAGEVFGSDADEDLGVVVEVGCSARSLTTTLFDDDSDSL